jgi:hypothetical protein
MSASYWGPYLFLMRSVLGVAFLMIGPRSPTLVVCSVPTVVVTVCPGLTYAWILLRVISSRRANDGWRVRSEWQSVASWMGDA